MRIRHTLHHEGLYYLKIHKYDQSLVNLKIIVMSFGPVDSRTHSAAKRASLASQIMYLELLRSNGIVSLFRLLDPAYSDIRLPVI